MPNKAWDGVVLAPISGRLAKPREDGWTMIIDKGLSLGETPSYLDLTADYIDLVKLTFGTSALYDYAILREKTVVIRERGIGIMPGGTLGEVAILQGRWKEYLNRATELGFNYIEISDGTISLGAEQRRAAIAAALENGFQVITEIGKKDPRDQPPLGKLIEQALTDLQAGAAKVIVEGRESGKGVVIYGVDGKIEQTRFNLLAKNLPPTRVIWEAPQKSQQTELIMSFGPQVNLGNIPPADVLALEALRLGLRGDTLRSVNRCDTSRANREES